MAELLNFTKERFMQEIQKYRIIYDKFSKDFKNIHIKKNAWISIGNVFGGMREKIQQHTRSAY